MVSDSELLEIVDYIENTKKEWKDYDYEQSVKKKGWIALGILIFLVGLVFILSISDIDISNPPINDTKINYKIIDTSKPISTNLTEVSDDFYEICKIIEKDTKNLSISNEEIYLEKYVGHSVHAIGVLDTISVLSNGEIFLIVNANDLWYRFCITISNNKLNLKKGDTISVDGTISNIVIQILELEGNITKLNG